MHDCLLELAPSGPSDLQTARQATAEASLKAYYSPQQAESAAIPEQMLTLVKCHDEKQIDMAQRFQSEGMEFRALVS